MIYIYEQRSRDAAAKKRANTSGVGKINNYCEDIYIPYSGLFSKNKFSAKSTIIGEKISHAFIFGQPGLGPKYTCDYYRYVHSLSGYFTFYAIQLWVLNF